MKWPKESSDNMGCQNSNIHGIGHDQLACQEFCEMDSGCVGVAWSSHSDTLCYLCQDDNLEGVCCGYGFYRKPLGNK